MKRTIRAAMLVASLACAATIGILSTTATAAPTAVAGTVVVDGAGWGP